MRWILLLPLLWALPAWAVTISVVRIEGLSRTREAVVRRELRLAPGSEADSAALADDADRLERLGVFAEITPQLDSGALTWHVKELPWVLPVPNGRLSDADGLSLGPGLKSPNFLGEAINLEALALLGGVTEWQLAATGSWLAGLPVGWDVFTNRSEREAPFYDGHETSLRNQFLLRWPSDRLLRLEGGAGFAWVREENAAAAVSPNRRDWIPSAMIGLQWDGRDRTGLTSKGLYQELLVERIGGNLGGDLDGWQFTSDTRAWMPLSKRFGIHAANLCEWQTGTVDAWRGFTVGGANSARFLPAAELRGRSENLSALELRWTLVEPHAVALWGQSLYWGLQALAGAEAAAAWDATWPQDFRTGPVAGLDFLVPYVGRIRLCGGWSSSAGGTVSAAVGLDEKTVAQRWKGR